MTSARVGLIVVFCFALIRPLRAQFSAEAAAFRNLRVGKWEKAHDQLKKALQKDSLNACASYGLSVYFFTPANPHFHLDSAHRFQERAVYLYRFSADKQRERWAKIPFDSIVLERQRERIDSAAFDWALKRNDEEGYIDFIKRFPQASQRKLAEELRDEVAYLNALRENTYQSFYKYIEKYPLATRAKEAKERYERLLFESRTKDKRLESYRAFLMEFPETPYRSVAERELFEIGTASGRVRAFENFLKNYPQSKEANRAKNILYHILREEERKFSTVVTDSLKELILLEQDFLVPVLKDDRYSFINEHGVEVLKDAGTAIQEEYLCGNITEDFLVVDDKILARNGVVIYKGVVDELDDLGYGFLAIRTQECITVVHVSGFRIGNNQCFTDAKLLGRNFIALQFDKKWSLWSLAGRMLQSFLWDNFEQVGEVLLVYKDGEVALTSLDAVGNTANQESLKLSRWYGEASVWSKQRIWVRHDGYEAVINQDLTEWVEFREHKLTESAHGVIAQTGKGFKIYSGNSVSPTYKKIYANSQWLGVKADSTWQLIQAGNWTSFSGSFDSLEFIGPFCKGFKADSVLVLINPTTSIRTLSSISVQFIPGKDSLFFLLIEEGEQKTIYSSKGVLLFSIVIDRIDYNNEGFFTVIKKGKRGLADLTGKILIPPEYDAMGTVMHGVVAVIKERKFGSIHLQQKKIVKPVYERNLVFYNDLLLIASQKNLVGLIDWNNKPVLPFEFEEIIYWSDSAALVKKNFKWMIYDLYSKKILIDNIKNFKWVVIGDEKILIIQEDTKYGVISNRRGIIIPSSFTDIINLGSAERPLYFTEKHIEEASLYIVIYYDSMGKQLRRQVFEADDYDKIYCRKSE